MRIELLRSSSTIIAMGETHGNVIGCIHNPKGVELQMLNPFRVLSRAESFTIGFTHGYYYSTALQLGN